MMMKGVPFFPNEELELYTYNPGISMDDYGELTSEYVYRETVPCDIQPLSMESSLKEFGKILQDTYTIFLDTAVMVYDTDKLKVNNVTYEIMGGVENWNHILKHQKLTVKRLRKGD